MKLFGETLIIRRAKHGDVGYGIDEQAFRNTAGSAPIGLSRCAPQNRLWGRSRRQMRHAVRRRDHVAIAVALHDEAATFADREERLDGIRYGHIAPARGGPEFAAALREHAVLVRHFNRPRTAPYLRITVGTEDDTRRLIAAAADILAEE